MMRPFYCMVTPCQARLSVTSHQSRCISHESSVTDLFGSAARHAYRLAALRRLDDRFKHLDTVLLVSAGNCERTFLLDRTRKVFQLRALGADFGKLYHLRLVMYEQVCWIHVARFHLPGGEMLYIAHFHPAFRAEHLHAPGFRSGDYGAQVAGCAVLEAKEHRGRVVQAEIIC